MGKALWKGTLLGGATLFVWSFLSWGVLPWHNWAMNNFTEEEKVAEVLLANAPASGIYTHPGFLPPKGATPEQIKAWEADFEARVKKGPWAFVAIVRGNSGPTPMTFVNGLLYQLLGALGVTWLLLKTTGLSFWGRAGFCVVFAVAAGAVTHLPYWNWLGFSPISTVISFADLVVGWFFAGLVIAKVAR